MINQEELLEIEAETRRMFHLAKNQDVPNHHVQGLASFFQNPITDTQYFNKAKVSEMREDFKQYVDAVHQTLVSAQAKLNSFEANGIKNLMAVEKFHEELENQKPLGDE